MRTMAVVLLVGVFMTHHTANWLADGSRFSPAAIFYMQQGMWAAILALFLLDAIWAEARSFWRSLAIAALVISIGEGLLQPVCRFAVDNINAVPKGVSLCDYVTGMPTHAVMLCVEIFAVLWIAASWTRKNGDAS